MAACGAIPATVFDTQIVAGFLGLSTPSLSRLVDQMLGVSLPKADRLSDWLVRPISERQITYALNDVAHLLELRDVLTEKLRALGRLEWALSECDTGARRPHPGPRPRGGVVEARRHPGHVAPLPRRGTGGGGLARAHGRRDQPAPPHGAVGPRAPGHRRSGRRATATSCAATRGVDGRHLAQGRAAEIMRAVERGLELPPDQIRMPSEGRGRAGPAGRGRRVLGRGAPDRRRPRLRPGPPRHAGRHRPAALRRAEPARYGLAPHHRRATRCAG